MTTERDRVLELATWTGGQLKAVKTYAAQQATAAANQVKTDILGGAAAAYDTLGELQAKMLADDSAVSGILTALGLRVRADAAQSFTAPQQAQARANIDAASLSADLGATDVDYVAAANTAMTT